MGGILIEEDLYVKYRIIDPSSPEGQRIHTFFLARAKALAGKYIDFDETPITFLLSDDDEPNAFFMDVYDPEKKPRRDDYKTIRYIRNPLPTPVICFTKGLIALSDTRDELDFVLGHELTHRILRLDKGIKHNSKGEESIADLHAVDLMYDAGSDPKQALLMSVKLNNFAQARKNKEREKRHRREEEEEGEGIDWSTVFDVHMTDSNRRAGIEASLTRLSHLIDDRQPTPLEREKVVADYIDPVEEYLRSRGYHKKSANNKLKILVDCVDHLSISVPAEEYFSARLAELNAIGEDHPDYWYKGRWEEEIRERIEAGYTDYFRGKVMPKKYQQKIANLAESVIAQADEDRSQGGEGRRASAIHGVALNTYLQDKAYEHIVEHGYPVKGDMNYRDASGMLYSYFYELFQDQLPRGMQSRKDAMRRNLPRLDVDINTQVRKIKEAVTEEDFITAFRELSKLRHITYEIGTAGELKLDNLSGVGQSRFGSYREEKRVYSKLKMGNPSPWGNLVEIAKTTEEAKKSVVAFLVGEGIEDFRVTHGLPYIRVNNYTCYGFDETGIIIDREVPRYEVDFSTQRETVLAAYEYIKKYFAGEESLVRTVCLSATQVNNRDFKEAETVTEAFSRQTVLKNKVYALISMFNALPGDNRGGRRNREDTAYSLIPERYRRENPMPGLNRNGNPTLSSELFHFDNPIFQAYFGGDFEEKLRAQKKSQQDQMFEASFSVLKKMIDVWIEVSPIAGDLNEELDKLRKEVWNLPEGEERKLKKRQKDAVDKKYKFYQEKMNQAEIIISNILSSIFERDDAWCQLNRLTTEQKITLARFAVRDEKGAVISAFEARGYERFCDYLGILEEQTTRVIGGDYSLTESMKIVAGNYGYKPARTQEEMTDFVQNHKDQEYRQENKKYAWYLHVFNTMEYLESNPQIDLYSLLLALRRIKEESQSSNGADVARLIEKRYINYNRLISEGSMVRLVSKAIDHQENYDGLSFDKKLKTADLLIAVRHQMFKALGRIHDDDYSGTRKISLNSEHQAFIELIDRNTNDLLRKAENEALQNSDSLEKIRGLFLLYNPEKDHYYSSEKNRKGYLHDVDKEEGRLAHISDLCQVENFWPIDVLEHIKAFVFAKNTFLDDKELENRILNDILDKLIQLPSGRKKTECLHILLDSRLRAAYPETRDRVFGIYIDDAATRLGKDDGSNSYQRRLAVYLKALEDETKKSWDIGAEHGVRGGFLSNTMSAADKYLLLRHLSDCIVSQERTSQMIKESCQISLGSDDMIQSYLYGIGVDYLTEEMDRDADVANSFIQFLNSKGENKDCRKISAYIKRIARKKYKKDESLRLDYITKFTHPADCKIFYENFWSAPLEARAFIIARMLKSAVNTKDAEEEPSAKSWERVFDVVMDNVIRPDDQSVEAKYAREIMHSYIKARSDYERVLILSAMMVANRNIGSDLGNVGKALRFFLENMGPAEIKLGQAIASHPNTPEKIKKELQNLKSSANIPPRWVVYDWIKLENIPEELWKGKYLGEIMGSASYYTSIALGEDDVLRILRPEAREKAAKGFRVIHAAVEDLEAKEGSSDLSYRELTRSVEEMIIQAARMSEIETDHELGEQQYKSAKELYDGVNLSSSDQSFNLKVMDWRAKGKNWIIMCRAKGFMFNDLPETTPEQIFYKKDFAKTYILFELTNILSGRKFDHDRHGAQLSIDPYTNKAGIYDTGAMALNDPSPDDQRILGNLIYGVLKSVLGGDNMVGSFGKVIGDKIEELHQARQDTQYFVEVKKGILALGDFFRFLDWQDIAEILMSIDVAKDLSLHVQNGITEKMSPPEREEWRGLMALQAKKGSGNIIVHRQAKLPQAAIVVDTFSATPQLRDKSGWLHDVFQTKSEGGETSSSFLFAQRAVNQNGQGSTIAMRMAYLY